MPWNTLVSIWDGAPVSSVLHLLEKMSGPVDLQELAWPSSTLASSCAVGLHVGSRSPTCSLVGRGDWEEHTGKWTLDDWNRIWQSGCFFTSEAEASWDYSHVVCCWGLMLAFTSFHAEMCSSDKWVLESHALGSCQYQLRWQNLVSKKDRIWSNF
jgi:hypothetical protein